uniref:Minor capsid protein VP1 n=1 Tax=Porcine bocavirus 3 TaxID=1084715 RepID=A0A513PZF6_9VIRU|nr:MAG: VP1 [Porcine bocavirus 3]
MSHKRGQFRGLLFPGYNYLGPFNPLENGDPVNKADEAAKKHDQAYNKYINKGLNPYLKFNKGDQDFIDSLQSDSSVGGNFARAVFHLKKQIAPALNEPKDTGEPPAKKDKRAGNKRHLYFARLNKGAKKAKADNNNMDGDMDNNEQGAGEGPAPAGGGGARSGGGGGGAAGGGGGGGNHGVGVSTGGWIGGSILGQNRIVTRNTRQWLCTIRDNHKYKQYTNWKLGNTNIHMQGYTTPWNMFNFNQYSSHFNPNEWQWLVNRAKRFRPVRMEVKIYNIQIKQESNQDVTAQYTNDLTAGLHVLCDGEHAFPWTQLPWDKGCMPELPHDIWTLQQYAYITCASEAQDTTGNGNELNIRGAVPMYLLEETDHAVIRTGESIVFHHSFDCGWVDNTRSSAMHQLACINPLIDSRLVGVWLNQPGNGTNEDQMRPYQKHGPWWPGPGYRDNRNTSENGTNGNTGLGPYFSVWKPEGAQYTSSAVKYGVPTGPYTGGQSSENVGGSVHNNANVTRFTPGDGPGGANNSNFFIQRSSVQTGTRDQALYKATGQSTSEIENVYMMPNQMWDSAPVSRYNPIWTKIPRVDRHTLLDTEDGTLPMTHPPGTIYVKLANIPTPNGTGHLNIYATGQVSCEIEWEYEENFNKNWRPERRIDANKMRADVYKINADGGYDLPQNYYETMPTRWGQEKVL